MQTPNAPEPQLELEAEPKAVEASRLKMAWLAYSRDGSKTSFGIVRILEYETASMLWALRNDLLRSFVLTSMWSSGNPTGEELSFCSVLRAKRDGVSKTRDNVV
jgi:hypothetical protein